MGQTNFENLTTVQRHTESESNEGNNASSRLYDAASEIGKTAALGMALNPAAKLGFVAGKGMDKFLSLPQVDITGFQQEAPYESQGGLKDLWHGVKHAFVKDASLDDKLTNHVEGKMSPEEKKKFDAENKALEDYRTKELAWAASTVLPPAPYPKRPDTPMHTEIDRRVQELEKKLTTEVRNSMSPTDLIRLDKQMSSYQQQVKEATTIRNPIGTGEAFRPMPKPGTTIQDYYLRVAEFTEKYLKSHSH